jgi:hypothetical protein
MAQTPQSGESGGGDGTTAPGTGGPQGLFGSSTTILLIIFAVAVFWWSRRRRVAMEEQLRENRREAEATAERSALDVANLMRAAPQPGAGAAAATEGLASAAPMPSARASDSTIGATDNALTANNDDDTDLGQAPLGGPAEASAVEIERAEARAAADRAAEEQAERAMRASQKAGESVIRRMAAAASAADEATADTVDATLAGLNSPNLEAQELAPEPPRTGDLPADAIVGDGTANCPPDYPIKGNRQSRIYHRPGQVSYPLTVAEYCFASEVAAELAGFRQSRARDQRTSS